MDILIAVAYCMLLMFLVFFIDTDLAIVTVVLIGAITLVASVKMIRNLSREG